jgi:hypothetical protein
MFKIKVLIPNDSIKYWYVTSIKKDKKGFSATSDLEDAKIYKNRKTIQPFLDYLLSNGTNYVLLDDKAQ